MEYGYVIGDRYICRKELGKGKNGCVYLAYDRKLCKNWAVKACLSLSEAEVFALKKIDYYIFPRIVDVIHQDNTEFIVMDYISGETLSSYCSNHAVSQKQLLIWCRELALGLHYLHSMTPAMIFCDLKPDNIMLTHSGEVRLIDFGSIYIDTIRNPIVTGTAFYAPCELAKEPPSVSSDVYSLGMTIYRLLTGSKTELRDSHGRLMPESINRNISPSVTGLIRRCTDINSHKRYQSMSDIINALDRIIGSSGKATVHISLNRIMMFLARAITATSIIIVALLFKDLCIYLITILFVLLIVLCRTPHLYSYETQKEIVRITVFALACCFYGLYTQKSAPLNRERLDITLYDQNNCKLLVRPGSTWVVDDDIRLSVSKDDLTSTPCTITITCDTDSSSKSYSFLCSAK